MMHLLMRRVRGVRRDLLWLIQNGDEAVVVGLCPFRRRGEGWAEVDTA